MVVKKSLYFVVLKYGSVVIGLISQVYLVRLLSPEVFGKFVYSLVIIDILFAVSGIPMLSSAITQRQYKRSDVLSIIYYITLILFSLYLMSFFIYYLLFYFKIVTSFSAALAILFFIKIVQIPSNLNLVYYMNQLEYDKVGHIEIIAKLMSVIFAIILATMYDSIFPLIVREAILAMVFLLGPLSFSSFSSKFFKPNFRIFTESMKIALNINTIYITDVLDAKIPLFLVSNFFGKNFLGLFEKTFYFASVSTLILQPFGVGVSFPLLSKHQEDADATRRIMDVNLLVIFYIGSGVCSLFFFYSERFFAVLLSDEWIFVIKNIKYLGPLAIFVALENFLKCIFIVHKNYKSFSIVKISRTVIYSCIISLVFLSKIDKSFLLIIYSFTMGGSSLLIANIVFKYTKYDISKLYFPIFLCSLGMITPYLFIGLLSMSIHFSLICFFFSYIAIGFIVYKKYKYMLKDIDQLQSLSIANL